MTRDAQQAREDCGIARLHKGAAKNAEPLDCKCPPAQDIDLKDCRCVMTKSGHWRLLLPDNKPEHGLKLIAYIRPGVHDVPHQLAAIEKYRNEHNIEIIGVFKDLDKPSLGLRDALENMVHCDGLIATDPNRFVCNQTDRMRELRPFIHHFFCASQKHLVTIEEGLDSGSPGGQAAMLELVNQNKEAF
jgi:hypothetical protein